MPLAKKHLNNNKARRRNSLSLLVLLVAVSCPAQTPGGASRTIAPVPVRKDSVVVTGTWEPLALEEADRSVVSVPVRGQDLLFNSFADILKLDPSLDLRQRGANGTQADLSVRGGSFGQTLILLNGRRMSDPQSGHHNLDLPVPLEAMESVEMLRGSGSTLYGSDAVGGVVNFITSTPEVSEIRLRGALGNFGVNQERASVTGVRGPWMEQLLVSRDFSTGFEPGRDYRNLTVSSTTRYRSRLGNSALDLGWADKPFGADLFYGTPNSWERTKTWYGGLQQSFGEKTEAAFAYRRHTDLFVLYRDRPEVFTNRHAGESWQASVRRRERLNGVTTLYYGVEGFGDNIDSNNLGVHNRQRGAGYVALDFRALKRFSLNVGLRDESYRGIFDQLSPSISAGYWAAPQVKLRASVSRAFRLPTYTDLYYHDPRNVGSPDLRPETAWNYEGGVEWRPGAAYRVEATVFHRRDHDGIDYVRYSLTDIWRATNFQDLRFTGVETAFSWRVKSSVVDLRYTGLKGVTSAVAGAYSKYVFNYPVHSAVAGWQGSWRGIAARTRIGVMERLGRDPYAVWDIYGSRASGRIRPFLQFTNLTGTSYQEIIGVRMPGRGIVGGVEIVAWRR